MSFKTLNTENLTILTKSKRSQSALEYMMTYGWAILIIVIVAVILYSMGIFNPSSSVTFTSSGFSPFTVSSSLCNNLGYKIAVLAGPIPNNANSITINKVFVTSATGANTTTASYTLTNPVTLKSGQSTTIIIPNVACTAAKVHYSLSAKIQYSYTAGTLGLQYVNTSGTIAGTSISGKPSALTTYEPITITNSQSSATPNPFQQMVNFTSSDNGWTSISTGNFGQNVEFFYYNGTIIPSWLESYTDSNAIWWLKIAAIPGGSSETVYVGFAPTSSNLFNTVNDGEAPQIPCGSTPTSSCSNYAEYDDGANVFIDYWNFAGTTIPSSFLLTNCGAGGGYNVNNGITLDNCQFIFSQQIISYPVIADIFVPILSDSSSAIYFGLSTELADMYGNGIPEEAYMMILPDSTSGGLGLSYQTNNGGGSVGSIPYTFSDDNVYSIDWVSTGEEGAYINYQKEITGKDTTVKIGNYYLFVGPDNSGASISFQWLRTRAYPPNGVMPSVSFGSVA